MGKGDLEAGDDAQAALGSVGDRGERVDGGDLEGQIRSADPGELGGEQQQVGAVGQRGQRPREAQREVELVGWVVIVVEGGDCVLEGEQHPGIDFEREVQVDGAAAALLGVQVHLPRLAQGVGLDEVALVVDVERVVHRVLLELRDVPGDIDGGHAARVAGRSFWPSSAGTVREWTTTSCSRCSGWLPMRSTGHSPGSPTSAHGRRPRPSSRPPSTSSTSLLIGPLSACCSVPGSAC